MSRQPDYPIRIFYDGSCSVCATEVEHYLRQDHCGKLVGVSISSADFNPEPFHIPLATFMYELHVIDRSGTVYRGVEAFRAIWQAFPESTIYGIMAAMLSMPGINPIARMLYKGFARIRRYLPKRHVCEKGTCGIGKGQ